MEKRLYRKRGGVLGGVCSGIAEVYDLDPSIVRLIWLGAVLVSGWALLLYLGAWIVIPREAAAVAQNGAGEAR